MKLDCEPIGYFSCGQTEKYMAPRQAELSIVPEGVINLCPGRNFEQALEDLAGFERIWLIYWFDRNETWKTKVATPRGGPKRGLFATRSPHRPNPIGLSCVELICIEGRTICVGKNDLLDGTPILDIKPYINYADAFPDTKQGWIDSEIPAMDYRVDWSELAQKQVSFIQENTKLDLAAAVELRLQENPYPFEGHRIKQIGEGYELAFKTWRLVYRVEEKNVKILHIASGYNIETLQGKKDSKWNDVPIHVEFQTRFQTNPLPVPEVNVKIDGDEYGRL